jgi:thioredoxin reductase-like selenoprotein T
MQLKKAIEHADPEISVTGGEYPAEPNKVLMARIIQAVQYGVMALLLAGPTIFATIGRPVPEALEKMFESRWMYLMLALFLGGNLQSSCLQTGAFEIYVDGKLIFSKLATGKMVQMSQIGKLLQQAGVPLAASPNM